MSDEVRNLAQVKAGDKVTVSFFEALAAEVRKEGEGIQGVETDVAAVRAESGAMPGGGVGVLLRTTVEIVSVDTSFNTVTFRRSDGAMRVVAIEVKPAG